MRLKNVFILTTLLGTAMGAQAQKFYDRQEWGIAAGAAQYFGDLNPEYGFKHIRPAAGVFYRYYFNPYLSARVSVNYVKLGYKDSYSNNEFQKIRNLSFENDIYEASVVGEFNFFYFETGNEQRRFTPYMVAGVGAIYSNPYTILNEKKYYLQPLGTEGQSNNRYSDRRYSKINAVIPFGAGIKYWIAPGVNFAIEFVHRFALTDYLDDVSKTYVGIDNFLINNQTPTPASQLQDPSIVVNGQKLGRAGKQRGDAATIDQYFVGQMTLSIQLKTYKCPSYNSRLWDAR